MWLLYTFVHLIWQLSLFFAVMLQIILRVISLGKCSWYNWILYQQCFSFFIRATHFAFLCSTVFLFVRLFVCFKVNCHWICIFKSLCFILLSSFSPFSFCLFYSFGFILFFCLFFLLSGYSLDSIPLKSEKIKWYAQMQWKTLILFHSKLLMWMFTRLRLKTHINQWQNNL